MYPPQKHSQNEKLKSLRAQTEMILDNLMDRKPNLKRALIQTLLIQVELIEAMKNPEDPG
jgi:hypothetical protein